MLKDFGNQAPTVYASPLDHLKIRSGLVLDDEPFLNSLRRVYQEQFAKSVSDAVTLYHSQICRLEATWSPENTTSGGRSSFLIDDEFT